VATVHIDTSGLTFPLFTIPGQTPSFIDGSTSPPPAVSLAPGSYSFQQATGCFCDFRFEVTAAGTIEYETTFDAFLGGRGGSTLVVGGFDVRLDGTALSHGLFPVIAGAGAFLMPDAVHDLKLVPPRITASSPPAASSQPSSSPSTCLARCASRRSTLGSRAAVAPRH
jgi:hypothetical protein